MPRQARQPGEFLHIIVRGNGKQILFEEDADRRRFLFLLQKYGRELGITVLAYCLMDNHVHLLSRDPQGASAVLMKKLGVSYAQFFNWKYEHTGHLFQDRYKSEVIADEAYLLAVFRYILNNPVKAGICRADQYPWSSYREYGSPNGLTDTEIFRELIGDTADFARFVSQSDDAEYMESEPRKHNDAWAVSIIQKHLHITNGVQLQQYDRKQRDAALALLKEKGLTIRQLERLTGINRGVIQRAKCVKENRPR